MGRIALTDGTLQGRLASEAVLAGQLSANETLRGELSTPQIIREYTSELDYRLMLNKPHINEHMLRAGENSLAELGLDVCEFSAIAALFE